MKSVHYILDQDALYRTMKARGFRSMSALARRCGIHRNTLRQLLSEKPVLSESLERVLAALDLPLERAVKKVHRGASGHDEILAQVVDTLAGEFPQLTFVLFGSRARKTERRYSDYDIGVYARGGVEHREFRRVYRRVSELEEQLPFFIDVVNLSRADHDFLNEASRSWIFLAGKRQDWLDLQKKAMQ